MQGQEKIHLHAEPVSLNYHQTISLADLTQRLLLRGPGNLGGNEF